MKTGLPLLLLTWIVQGVLNGVVSAADVPTQSAYHQDVRKLLPVAWWSFSGAEPELGLVDGKVEFGADGPSSSEFKSFPEQNGAARFIPSDGQPGGVIRLQDVGSGSQFDFDNGDPITFEAWVNPSPDVRSGSTMYILGKGRTGNPGQAPENQNYGFRIVRSGITMKLSFLFRSRDNGEHKSAWHRWDSSGGFVVGSGWHHIAMTYVFGEPGSIKGYVDGEVVDGRWDPAYAGPTNQPPVVDDDEVWVGSGMGRSAGSSFNGLLDEVALYRRVLSADQLSEHYPLEPYVPKFGINELLPGSVRVEIVEHLRKIGAWPRKFAAPSRVYEEDLFGFFDVPENYVESGVRAAWSNPFLLRAATTVILPVGEQEWLLRVRGKGRLWLDDKVIAEIDYGHFGGGAHNDVHEEAEVEGKDLRYLGPGDREALVTINGDGEAHTVVLEMVGGNGRVRATLGETSLSVRQADGGFVLLGGADRKVALTDAGWDDYRRERMAYLEQLNRERRLGLRASEADYWKQRHELARKTAATWPEPRHHKIEEFLKDAWEKTNQESTNVEGGVDFNAQIRPILAEHCFRCHDEKVKGGLRLSSREALLKGGDSEEPGVVPGNPDESLVMQRIRSEAGDDIMPPKGDPLTATQRELIARWISEGASYASRGRSAEPTALTEDLEFLRRVTLDTVGMVPSFTEIEAFLQEQSATRRESAIERLLADDRWAGHWTAYWQDVLAENPNILKPSLNNSGPFRFWIHEALEDNLPIDRFVTELVLMKGDSKAGGPAGFGIAAQNDVPMAAKAHILGTAFLGVEMKCARCHDAPYHASKQQDLFQVAAMLKRDAIELPISSSVPIGTFAGRKPLIKISLEPGTTVEPNWPESFAHQFLAKPEPELLRTSSDPREQLAAMITSPENPRFPRVIVNRLWKRFIGVGFVDPVDDWEASNPSHPELLDWLARELVSNQYDVKHLTRLILNSQAYQRRPRLPVSGLPPDFAAPAPRRMTAEQVVDSLFAVAGLPLESEELTMDNDGTQSAAAMISLGHPRRAWEFTSLSNERDRPSLAIPRAQAIVDVLENFGWRPSRQEPRSARDLDPNVRQPAIIANGAVGRWVTTLSEEHAFTQLALRSDFSVEELVEAVYLRVLTRLPTAEEGILYANLLGHGFESRVVPEDQRPPAPKLEPLKHVSWSNHLSEEANRIKIELEKRAREGEPPTVALSPDWRRRFEDMLWALLNSPEFIYLP